MSRDSVAIFMTLIIITSTTPLSNADTHGIPHDTESIQRLCGTDYP